MFMLVISIAWAALIALLLARAIRQYGYYQVIRPDERKLEGTPGVAIIIPARNEERSIGRCLEGLLRQTYPKDSLSIVVIDDGSADQTAAVVRSFSQKDPRVVLMDGAPLPEGWTGKSHACWQGADAVMKSRPQWLCFLDADTVASPALLNTAIRTAQERGVDLLSLEPFQELVSPAERLILPAGFFLIAYTQDVREANDPNSDRAHANGQFMLIRREIYESIGTFAAVRGQIAEDSALARLVKQTGGKVAVLGTDGLIRTRMYRDFLSLRQGLSRQAGELLGSAMACIVTAFAALLLGWTAVLLPIAAFSMLHRSHDAVSIATVVFAISGSLALLGTHIGAACYFKIPFWYGVLFPIGYTLGAGIALDSAVSHARGRVRWKGREYAPNQAMHPSRSVAARPQIRLSEVPVPTDPSRV